MDATDFGCGVDIHAAMLRSPAREALETVVKRRAVYGSPLRNFQEIAGLWNVCLGRKLMGGAAITPADVAQMMRMVKEARLIEAPDHWDSLVDVVGYIECHADVVKP